MLGSYCRGQPRGSPKKPGGSCLKPAKNANANQLAHLTRIHSTTANPGGPHGPPGQHSRRPTNEVCLARGLGTPSSKARLARGHPCTLSPPRSRLPQERTCSRTRVRALHALTQQSRATTRLGIRPRRCSANSLGGAHPHHCGELCDEAGVSSVTLCRPLLYG
jgi:hypothetical protein